MRRGFDSHQLKGLSLMCLRSVSLLLAALSTLAACGVCPAAEYHAFRPGQQWLDDNGEVINAHGGGILHHEGVYYWFGEHKIAGRRGNTAQVGVHVYASTDLYNWRDEGIALAVSDDPDSDIVRGCVIERPKVIYNATTNRFVMWFHLELRGQGYAAARSGVAVADRPTGPYTFLRSGRAVVGQWPLNLDRTPERERWTQPEQDDQQLSRRRRRRDPDGEIPFFYFDFPGGQMARDMTLFVDDDGAAYHLYASEENRTFQIARLTDDYLDHAGDFVRVFERRLMEAPAICRRQGKYYFLASGCTGWAPNAARSAVADAVFGPWQELGNPCVGVNSANGLGPEKTFGGQSTFILPVAGREDAYIAMFDIWRPRNPIDGRYVWLPIEFTDDGYQIRWRDEWDLSVFDKP